MSGSDESSLIQSSAQLATAVSKLANQVAVIDSKLEGLDRSVSEMKLDRGGGNQLVLTELRALDARMTARLDATDKAFNESRRVNWPLVISLVGAAGGIFYFISSAGQKDSALAIAPITLKVNALERDSENNARSIAGNRAERTAMIAEVRGDLERVRETLQTELALANESKTNRKAHDEQIAALQKDVADGRAARVGFQSRVSSQLAEIETQFASEEQFVDLRLDRFWGVASLLWQRVCPGERLEPPSVRPKISQERIFRDPDVTVK